MLARQSCCGRLPLGKCLPELRVTTFPWTNPVICVWWPIEGLLLVAAFIPPHGQRTLSDGFARRLFHYSGFESLRQVTKEPQEPYKDHCPSQTGCFMAFHVTGGPHKA